MSRIEELERRVRQDPASITFGALAEEYRRAGRLDDAISACRAGLERHPSYVSARVTLGRALQQLGQSEDARAEFEQVLSLAPDNLAAIRGLAEMHGIDAPETVHESYAPAAPAFVRPVPGPQPEPEPAPEPALTPEPESRMPTLIEAESEVTSAFGPGDPDFAALDASIAAASAASDVSETADIGGAPEAQRVAQIERLEIWLARLDEMRRSAARRA